MVSLANQARLLAAQAFNKRVIEEKARKRQAKIDRERAEDLAKLRGVQSARAVAQRKAIEAKARRESQRVFTRVTKGANVGVLTGFEARRNSQGKAIGISTRESQTRKNTKALLLREIARQKQIASRESDLERFLKNERAINAGQVSSSALKRQIADRKRRGLSQTPAQKRASQFFRDTELRSALSARSTRKGRPKLRATFGSIVSERARAKDLGSSPFSDDAFAFGGRTKKEVIARGGTFGRRVGGASISSQLSFIDRARKESTSGRISFAQGLLGNLNFSGSSQSSLLTVIGNKRLKAPATFQARLREGVGFFTTEAVPITKPKLSRAGRASLVSLRKAEDVAKREKARKEIKRQARSTTQNVFDLAGLGFQLDASNLSRGRNIELANQRRKPRFSGGFTLSPFDVSIQAQQAQAPREISFLQPRDLVGLTKAQIKQRKNRNLRDQGFTASQIRAGVQQGDTPDLLGIGGGLSPPQKRAQAEARQREIELFRDSGGGGIFGAGGSFGRDDLEFATGVSGLTRATGSPSETITTPRESEPQSISIGLEESLSFSDSLGAERVEGNIFNVNLTESIAFGDAPKTKKKKGKSKTKRISTRGALSTPRSDFDIFDLTSLLSFESPPRQRVGTKPKKPAPLREQSGIVSGFQDFLAIGGSGAGSVLAEPFTNPQSALRTGDFSSVFGGGAFAIDPNFDPAKAGKRTAQVLLG